MRKILLTVLFTLLFLVGFCYVPIAAAQTSVTGRVEVGLAAARPVSCVTAGDVYISADGPYEYVCGPAGTWNTVTFLESANTWTGKQIFKGIEPWASITAFGAVAQNTSSYLFPFTISVAGGSASATASVSWLTPGWGITIRGAGDSTGMSTPGALYAVTPVLASTGTASQETYTTEIDSPTSASTYSYAIVGRDKFGGLTPVGPTTTITNGQPTLGLQTCTISTLTNSGDTMTVVCSNAITLAIGARVHIYSTTPADFSGWFNVSTVNNGTKRFTVANTGIDTTKGAPTSSTGGFADYYLGNIVQFQNPTTYVSPTNVWEYYICGQRPGDGSMHPIGVTLPTLAGGPQVSAFFDWGATNTANQQFPYYVTDAICTAVTGTNDPLTTTVDAVNGTAVTLHNTASNSVTTANTLIDTAPAILAAANSITPSASGIYGTVYIPPAPNIGGTNCWQISSYLKLPDTINIQQAGNLCLSGETLALGIATNWNGQWSSSSNPQFGFGGNAGVYVEGASPAVYQANAAGTHISNLNIFAGAAQSNGGVQWMEDNSDHVSFDFVNFQTNRAASTDMNGIAIVFRSNSSGGNEYYANHVAWMGGPNGSTVSWAPLVFFPSATTSVDANALHSQILYGKDLSMSLRGFEYDSFGGISGAFNLYNLHRQGGVAPLITHWSGNGASYTADELSSVLLDTDTTGLINLLAAPGSSVALHAVLNGVTSSSSQVGGIPPAISGERVTDVLINQGILTAPYINTILFNNGKGTFTNTLSSPSFIGNGTICTNGELALGTGWQSTGSATVTGVVGTGQTCEWTITTGTTTAANPTVTDTLTNALPNASTTCWMTITGGNRTAAAGDSFDQTTLSATAPIFTFQGTPTAGGKTYKVVRTCGP